MPIPDTHLLQQPLPRKLHLPRELALLVPSLAPTKGTALPKLDFILRQGKCARAVVRDGHTGQRARAEILVAVFYAQRVSHRRRRGDSSGVLSCHICWYHAESLGAFCGRCCCCCWKPWPWLNMFSNKLNCASDSDARLSSPKTKARMCMFWRCDKKLLVQEEEEIMRRGGLSIWRAGCSSKRNL